MATRDSSPKGYGPVVHLIVASFSLFTALCIFQPFLPNLLLGIFCPGQNECGVVIWMIGALQLGMGIGSVVISPILGGLSDSYGRKPILVLVFATRIIPQVILAFMKTKTGVYLWFFASLISYIFTEGGLIPTLLASVADVLEENYRPTGNGLAIGSLSAGFMAGTVLSTAFKTVDQALWGSLIVQVFATIYLLIFFKETNPRRSLLSAIQLHSDSAVKLLPKDEVKGQFFKDFKETVHTVWRSRRLMIIVLVNFLNMYGLTGLESFTVYYLIAAFNYGEKQLALIYLLGGAGSTVAMMVVYPALSRIFEERTVLWISLLAAVAHYLFYGLAWTSWVPYIAAGSELFASVTKPALGTMVSRGVDREQQGKMQGFMSAVRAAAIILAPLTITPLAAISLRENPPLGLMGFPFILLGSAMVLASLITTALPPLPRPTHSEEPAEYIQAPEPPVEVGAIVPSLS